MAMTAVQPHEQCVTPGCGGIKAPTLNSCFVHADQAGFQQAFQHVHHGGDVRVDLRSTPLTQTAIDRLVGACPTDGNGRRMFATLDCRGARPTEPIALTRLNVDRLSLDELVSPAAVKLDVHIRTAADLYDLRCDRLNVLISGPGRLTCDRVSVDELDIILGGFSGEVRGSPVVAQSTFLRSGDSGSASVRLDGLHGARCTAGPAGLRRLEITTARLSDELDIAAVNADEGVWLTGTRCGRMSLEDCEGEGIVLNDAQIGGDVALDRCALSALLAGDATIDGELTARESRFDRALCPNGQFGAFDLAGCTITDEVDLSDTSFTHLVLDGADIGGQLSLSGAQVAGHASMRAVRSGGPVMINGAGFLGSFSLNHLRASDIVTLSDVEVGGALGLRWAYVEGDLTITATRCAGLADLVDSTMAASASVHIDAESVDLTDAVLHGPARMRFEATSALLVDATFHARGELTCTAPDRSICALDLRAVEPRERLLVDGRGRTALIDLRRARCDGIRLQAVSLERCLFDAATGLEEMRLTGDTFARRSGPVGRGRVVVAEDPDFSTGLLDEAAGSLPAGAESTLAGRRVGTPGAIAQLYRSLRKGLEDSKDSAGASEFYFAEMQMRRRNPSAGAFERAVLTAYRFLGGYGVRPLAPALWLVVLLIAATLAATAFDAVQQPASAAQQFRVPARDCGFEIRGRAGEMRLRCDELRVTPTSTAPTRSADVLDTGLIVTSSAIGFTRALDQRLRPGGQVIIMIVRLLGAALLAFVILGLRSAVRR
jgi:uncharacterized protein YjbI with pentapeptide repeats